MSPERVPYPPLTVSKGRKRNINDSCVSKKGHFIRTGIKVVRRRNSRRHLEAVRRIVKLHDVHA